MINAFPGTAQEFMGLNWSEIEPYYRDLASHPINQANLSGWMADWSRLRELVAESYARHYVATTRDTSDEHAQALFRKFLDEIFPADKAADQALKNKLIASGLVPERFELPLRNLRAEVDLFRDENLPWLADEIKLSNEYDKVNGSQTVYWEGEELTLTQLQSVLQSADREQRERAWRLASDRRLADRESIDALWVKFLHVRTKLAENAGKNSYRDYRWQQLLRFDYGPEECYQFHHAIEKVAVPAASRIYEKRRRRLSLPSLRPWDLDVDPLERPALRPFNTIGELIEKTLLIFQSIDPQLGNYFKIMQQEGLLDLENRKGKAPGGYCIDFAYAQRPFIFMNAVNVQDDVLTLLHESGHAFHNFEMEGLPYYHQRQVSMEIGEVASMGMELLAFPYLSMRDGSFYTDEDAARAHVTHLEQIILFWPYMAVVDAFQHWVYENPQAAMDPGNCDARWGELFQRFTPDVDWSGLEQEMITGWQRKAHIHDDPFYYIEYGLAQSGAVQLWAIAQQDQAKAVSAYRRALSLGNTHSIPELYRAADLRFAFDEQTLRGVITLLEEKINQLDPG